MQLHRISFSSRAVVEDPFKWAYTLEDHGYTGWEIVQEGSQCLSSKTVQKTDLLFFMTVNIITEKTGVPQGHKL